MSKRRKTPLDVIIGGTVATKWYDHRLLFARQIILNSLGNP
jgi:hypothetical protein